MEQLAAVSVRYLKGIGPKRLASFEKRGIKSVEDLLYHFPRRYEDRTRFASVAELQEGLETTIRVSVRTSGQRRSWRRRGFSITEALVEDPTGRLTCVWFNQPYLKQYLKPGTQLILYGKIERYAGKAQMTNPEFEVIADNADARLNIGRIVPVYPLLEGMGQRSLRKLMHQTIEKYISRVHDCLPYDVRSRVRLLNLAQSLINIHFPQDPGLRQQAYERLAFEEFFIFQLPLALRKLRRKQAQGIAHRADRAFLEAFVRGLPFALTESQKAVVREIVDDMACPRPMHRLLQGDVGSGKTVVATIAAMVAIGGGYQAAFMVPTEILARQHWEKIRSHVASHQSPVKKVKVGLLTSSTGSQEKKRIIQEIKNGEVNLVIGTHALLEGEVQFRNLGLVVIDEQHRFGVSQRWLLPQKGKDPDVLIMTATPIPRTLAITLYGDLDVSVIKELPAGRKPIKTEQVTSFKRPWVYDRIRQAVEQGRQAYIVYPLIEESFALDLLSAKKMYEEFRTEVFKEYAVGMVHGKLSQKEQSRVMDAFKENRIQILIATTVLEVGIDVANAALMVIEHAERFGLSQLHQLRGRVGRGSWESSCILVSDAPTAEAKARLAAMVSCSDGFRIAEQDLKIRGPGEYFGSRQHGLSGLRIGDPLSQLQLLKHAREEAISLIARDPRLDEHANLSLKERLLRRFPEYEKLIFVG